MRACCGLLLLLVLVSSGCGKPTADSESTTDVAAPKPAEEGDKPTPPPAWRSAARAREAANPRNIDNSLGMKLVLIPAGEFQMGAPETDVKAREEEKPQHLVRISEPFYMAVNEVTHAEYELLMKWNPSSFSRNGQFADRVAGDDERRLPVMYVTWNDAVEFCRLLSERPEEKAAGRVYRLPTEAEWEYACRAGTQTAYSWGDTIAPSNAAFDHTEVGAPFLGRPKPVGSYPPNPFGLHDMHGNAEEWCQDYFSFTFYANSPKADPINRAPGQLGDRVLRGGHFNSHPIVLRSSRRESAKPDSPLRQGGIRLVLPAPAVE